MSAGLLRRGQSADDVLLLVPKHDSLHNKLNSTIQEVSNYYGMLEEREKQALRSAMIEERSRFCTLFALLKPVMVSEIECLAEQSVSVSDQRSSEAREKGEERFSKSRRRCASTQFPDGCSRFLLFPTREVFSSARELVKVVVHCASL